MILVIDHDIFINFQVIFYTKFGTYVKNVFNILPLCKSTPENQNITPLRIRKILRNHEFPFEYF